MRKLSFLSVFLLMGCAGGIAQNIVAVDSAPGEGDFPIVAHGHATPIFVPAQSPETVRIAAEAFAEDVERVSGLKPRIFSTVTLPLPSEMIAVGVVGHSRELDRLQEEHKIDVSGITGKWEAAQTEVVLSPGLGVKRVLAIAGSDRRGAAYALFTLSRQMGVSPWTWWADVPVQHHDSIYVKAGQHLQAEPSVQYRGIFLNDEDWGLRPWAAQKMDPTVDGGKGNIGPHTYERIFELLLRLHANSLWPAMHPGSLAFNAVPENARLADKWSIVMGSSHSEALLRNNVGEWNEAAPPAGDGPWNYQINAQAMNAYWDKRLEENGKYENFYTVGLRGVHDSGLEAKGTPEVKARLVEDAMAAQRKLLAERVNPDVSKIPQILWLYKESLDLYRVGMKVPDDVTLGWTDDNYGYIRELPNAEEQKRSGGSGVYYHVSYWGSPHDSLWLCSTPPSLIREEMSKAYDHGARRYWILNVGDLKPAEMDIDYFMQLAVDESAMAKVGQREFLTQWFAEQFPSADAKVVAEVMTRYYALNFVRRPEFMGFNGYNDGIKRTAFNPLAWGGAVGPVRTSTSATEFMDDAETGWLPDQNRLRAAEWTALRSAVQSLGKRLPQQYASAFFELVDYPIEGAAAMNEKFLATDLTYLDAHNHEDAALAADSARAHAAYDAIQTLTAKYNSLEDGKWDGMMSSAPRERHVFEMPRTATAADANLPLPAGWSTGDAACRRDASRTARSVPVAVGEVFFEQKCTVSINAAHFADKFDGRPANWNVLADLGISGESVVYGSPGLLANSPLAALNSAANESPSLEYDFTILNGGSATLALHLLPTFPVDSRHKLRYAVALDTGAPMERDMSDGGAKAAGAGDGPSGADWPRNVLRNSAIDTIPLGTLAPGRHSLRLLYRDPGVVFEHLVITFPGAPPAYPVPPETK